MDLKLTNETQEEKLFSIAKHEKYAVKILLNWPINYFQMDFFQSISCDYRQSIMYNQPAIIHYFSNENLFKDNLSRDNWMFGTYG